MNTSALFCIIVTMFGFSYASESTDPVKTKTITLAPSPAIRLQLDIKEQYKTGEAIPIGFILENTSSNAMEYTPYFDVNRSLTISGSRFAETSLSTLGEIEKGSIGTPLIPTQYATHLTQSMEKKINPTLLAPGQKRAVQINLSRLLDCSVPGIYRLDARWTEFGSPVSFQVIIRLE